MKRGILLGGTALVGTVGSFLYSVGSFMPGALVGASAATDTSQANGDSNAARMITGDAVDTHYGTVQVEIAVEGSTITDITVLQAPSGRNDRWTSYSVPILTQEALAAQSADISVVSGASYTSIGFIDSLASAIAQM